MAVRKKEKGDPTQDIGHGRCSPGLVRDHECGNTGGRHRGAVRRQLDMLAERRVLEVTRCGVLDELGDAERNETRGNCNKEALAGSMQLGPAARTEGATEKRGGYEKQPGFLALGIEGIHPPDDDDISQVRLCEDACSVFF